MNPVTLDDLIHPTERVALFIDGANLHAATRTLSFDIDYRKLLDAFKAHGRFVRAYYYTAVVLEPEFSPLRPLVDWLDYNGYTLVTRTAKEYTDANGRRRLKGNMDVDIAVGLLEASAYIDHAFLFSGDGDFVAAILAAQRKGVRVSVISTVKSNPPMASDEIRRASDNFIELADLSALIGRAPKDRAGEARVDEDV
jgi:uncharacterized LabA/DUF88 family protein